MQLPRQQAQTVENVIERRLVETMIAGGFTPMRKLGPVRKASAAGTGLFLVTSTGSVDSAATGVGAAPGLKEGRTSGAARPGLRPEKNDKKASGRVTPMQLAKGKGRQEGVVGLMAAAGPVVWFAHAALMWLKAV